MVGDGKTDNSPFIAGWVGTCMSTNRRCYLPAGNYLLSEPFVLDLSTVRSRGITMFGDGANASILHFTTTSSPAFSIECQICTENSNPRLPGYVAGGHGAFYSSFRSFHVVGTLAGTVLRVGLPATAEYPMIHPDAMNGFTFDDMIVNNSLADPLANAVELNGVFESRIWMTTNAHEKGVSLRMTGVAYSTISGSYSGANAGIHITGGNTFGNTFNNLDLEVVNTALIIDSPGAFDNTFIGGVYALNGSAINAVIDATKGYNNTFINPHTSPTFQFFANGGKNNTGVSVIQGGATVIPAGSVPTAAGRSVVVVTKDE